MLLTFNFPVTHSFFMVNLHGPIVALLTPFNASGEIEWQAFKTYLSSMYSWGVCTVIANGTTGEFPSLTINERQQVVEFVRENFDGTIVNNVSATCVSDVRDLIAGTQGCADFILLLPPYYYSACQDTGLCRFFISALSGTSLPVMLYNFPQHTGNRLGVDLVAMLLEQDFAVQGIKDSSGDIGLYAYLQYHAPRYVGGHFAGALAHRISETAMSVNHMVWSVLCDFWPILVTFAVSITLLLNVHQGLSLLVAGWVFAYVSLSYFLAKRCQPYAQGYAATRSQVNGKIVDAVTNILNAKLFARLAFEREYLDGFLETEVQAGWCTFAARQESSSPQKR
jgi:ABC-type multidrug transport system fused ATPase/permease subunit